MLVVLVFFLSIFQLVLQGLYLTLELSNLVLFRFVLRLELDKLLIALSKIGYFAVLFTLIAFQFLLFAIDLLCKYFHPSSIFALECFVLFVLGQYCIDFLLELMNGQLLSAIFLFK